MNRINYDCGCEITWYATATPPRRCPVHAMQQNPGLVEWAMKQMPIMRVGIERATALAQEAPRRLPVLGRFVNAREN